MKYSRILFILVVVFFTIIIGEFYYLFFVKRSINSISNATPTNMPIQNLFPSPHPDQAFSEGSLVNLRVLKKGIVTSSLMQYSMEGIIDQISYLNEQNIKAINFTIKAKNGNSNTFNYPEKPYFRVYNNKKEMIDIFSIKKNDLVTIDIVFDIINSEYKNITINIL